MIIAIKVQPYAKNMAANSTEKIVEWQFDLDILRSGSNEYFRTFYSRDHRDIKRPTVEMRHYIQIVKKKTRQ